MKDCTDKRKKKFICYDRRSKSKLNQIRRLILSGQHPYVVLTLIMAVVFPLDVIASLKR